MCLYGNVYIPKKGMNLPSLPDTPEGLVISLDAPFQTNFATLHNQDEGLLASLHDGHCLCDYNDWGTLFDYLESIRTINNLDKIEFLLYCSDGVYPLTDRRVLDASIDTIEDKPVEGIIYEIRVSVPKRLFLGLGKEITILLKSGRNVRGLLESYDSDTGNTVLQIKESEEKRYFHEKEIKQVTQRH